jgi:hypothetical protein
MAESNQKCSENDPGNPQTRLHCNDGGHNIRERGQRTGVETMARLKKQIETESKKQLKTNSESAYSALSLQQTISAMLRD